MRKIIFLIICQYGIRLFSQSLTVEQIKTDIDSVIYVLSDIHPTFNGSSNKQALYILRDTIDTPLTSHELFKILQPLVTLDGHTTLQFTGAILPEIENPLLPFETIIYENRLYVKHNLSADKLLKKGTEILYINGKKMNRISRETEEFIHELEVEGAQQGKYFIYYRNPELHKSKPNRFTGKIYILTGPRSYSASGMFAAAAKCYSDACVVGEETGQPLISNGDISRHKLPNSGMNLYTSHSIYYFPCARNKEESVKPDIEVTMGLNDLLNDSNRYLKYMVVLIRSQERD
jgi:hypothetical protein